MDLGKKTRINRIFGHPSGRLCSLAVDHFVGYQLGLPKGLVNVPETIDTLVAEKPDAITMLKGMAKAAWPKHAGKIPLIVQSIYFTPDDQMLEQAARPEEVLRMGADAIAVAIGVRGPIEGKFLKMMTGIVEEADKIGLPVIAHIYPRVYDGERRIVHDHDNILWAVRCGLECGADVIKVPYTGSVESYREIVATCPVPLVAAGGPKCDTLLESLEQMRQVMEAGALGATIGRNIWGAADPCQALRAFKAVIHDGAAPEKAINA